MKSIFSIRYKFLLVTTLLLVLCVGTYLILAASIMKQDKTELVYDYNRSTVTNIASDLESFFRSVSDRLELSAFFYQSSHGKEKRILKSLLDNDSDTVFVAASSNFKDISQTFHINTELLDTYGITSEFFINTIENIKPIPFEKIKIKVNFPISAPTYIT